MPSSVGLYNPAFEHGSCGVAMVVDRSDGTLDLGVPLIPLIRLDVETFDPLHLPPDLAAIPATKPGSK
jgi:orotate phosphoribosyltransferase